MLDVRDNLRVRIERSRDNVFTVTATSQELSALIAGARMALEALRAEALGAGRPALGGAEQPGRLGVEVGAVPAAGRARHARPISSLYEVRAPVEPDTRIDDRAVLRRALGETPS
jgi:hypothetical protein